MKDDDDHDTSAANNNMTPSSETQTSHNKEDDASTVYQDASTNDLTILTSALLLTADCMGTGILALPSDVQTLGRGFGLAFLIVNLPVNLYAGTILGWSAYYVEEKILNGGGSGEFVEEVELTNGENLSSAEDDTSKECIGRHKKQKDYSSVQRHDNECTDLDSNFTIDDNDESADQEWMDEGASDSKPQHVRHTDTATFDFIGMTSILFDEPILKPIDESFDKDSSQITDDDDMHQSNNRHRTITYNHPLTKLVLSIYYVNIFLVLGKSYQ